MSPTPSHTMIPFLTTVQPHWSDLTCLGVMNMVFAYAVPSAWNALQPPLLPLPHGWLLSFLSLNLSITFLRSYFFRSLSYIIPTKNNLLVSLFALTVICSNLPVQSWTPSLGWMKSPGRQGSRLFAHQCTPRNWHMEDYQLIFAITVDLGMCSFLQRFF